MKKTRKLSFIIIFICYCPFANAQEYINSGTRRLDSLKQALKTVRSDTAQIHLLNQLAQQYIDLNFLAAGDSTAREALRKATLFNYSKHKGDSYNKIGLAHITRNEMDSAKIYFIKALDEDKRAKDMHNYIKHLGNIGICYVIQNKYDQALSCHKSALNMAKVFNEKDMFSFCYNNIGIEPHLALNDMFAHENYKITSNKDSLQYIIISESISHEVGTYTNGGTATKLEVVISVIDVNKGVAYELKRAMGSDPPQTIRTRRGSDVGGTGSIFGEADIFYFLKSKIIKK